MDPETKELVEALRDYAKVDVDMSMKQENLYKAADIIESLSKENADLKSYIKEQK